MGNNIFYVYIRLKDVSLTELPFPMRQVFCSNCDGSMIFLLSVCKEHEMEECLSEKVKFWKESIANMETIFGGADLVIHQIQTSNGGLNLSYAIMGDIAEAKLNLSMTYSVCKLT